MRKGRVGAPVGVKKGEFQRHFDAHLPKGRDAFDKEVETFTDATELIRVNGFNPDIVEKKKSGESREETEAEAIEGLLDKAYEDLAELGKELVASESKVLAMAEDHANPNPNPNPK